MAHAADVVTERRDELGEGPRWDAATGELVSVDILAGTIHRQRWVGGRLEAAPPVSTPGAVGASAPASGGGWVAACTSGILRTPELVAGCEWSPVALLPDLRAGVLRCNDAVCAPDGALLVGTMAFEATPGVGSLWRVAPEGGISRLRGGLTIPNGLDFSPDGATLWFTDTADGWIGGYDTAATTAGQTRLSYRLDPPGGSPDGLAVDAEGYLWVALWGDGCVVRLSPDGREVDRVTVPTSQPTAVCLGGEGLGTLFITSAWHGMAPGSDVHAGAVFAAAVDVPGLPVRHFG